MAFKIKSKNKGDVCFPPTHSFADEWVSAEVL